MDWTEVVTHPLGLVGFALSLVFGVVAKTKKKPRWVMPVSFVLAAVCIIGGMSLAYQIVSTAKLEDAKTTRSPTARTATLPNLAPGPANSMQIGTIKQEVKNGNAISGVQGNVTTNAPASQNESKPKP